MQTLVGPALRQPSRQAVNVLTTVVSVTLQTKSKSYVAPARELHIGSLWIDTDGGNGMELDPSGSTALRGWDLAGAQERGRGCPRQGPRRLRATNSRRARSATNAVQHRSEATLTQKTHAQTASNKNLYAQAQRRVTTPN